MIRFIAAFLIFMMFSMSCTYVQAMGGPQDNMDEKDAKRPIIIDTKKLRKHIQTDDAKEVTKESLVSVEAVFLGPQGENANFLEDLLVEAFRDHVYWRRNFHPLDPSHITEVEKRSETYLRTQDTLQKYFRLLLSNLKRSVPFFSLRYQAHMNWETTIPSIIGYFSAMLYNSNNVAYEASPVTSLFEEQAANDLSKMIGYNVLLRKNLKKETDSFTSHSNPFAPEDIVSWGHLTCDGTVANIEALWAARNLKFYPLAVKWALEKGEGLEDARGLKVKKPDDKDDTGHTLIDLSEWDLLNLNSDETLSLPAKVQALVPILPIDEIYKKISRYSLQTLGWNGVYKEIAKSSPDINDPVVLISGARHYSFPKAISLLGLGEQNLWNIYTDSNARLNADELQSKLESCAKDKIPVIAVVAIMGTTEESAVDPLDKILTLRETFRKAPQNNLNFFIHADSAYGGYFLSLLRGEKRKEFGAPVTTLSPYVAYQFNLIKEVDSVTIDPHKCGYVSYPAGALCYRNSATKNMVNFTAPYIAARDEEEPTVGTFGIEGSKPGATGASVYLTHQVIPLTKAGYGQLLGQSLFSMKKFYLRLLAMDEADFFVVPLAQWPGTNEIVREKESAKKELAQLSSEKSRKKLNDYTHDSFTQLGPDLNIITYAFNFRHNGKVNTDQERANEFNKAIYDIVRPKYAEDISKHNLILSFTTFEEEKYGPQLLENFLERLGINKTQNTVNVLRSVIMDPWITETEQGSFLDVIEAELKKTAKKALNNLKYVDKKEDEENQ
jgi:glutamate/tyrosine decarboxylase-like PLP-dependent enzyme